MKQAFHGEIFDTANALLIACHEPAAGIDALKGQRVFDLYRTPSGSYFKYETTASLFVEDVQPEIIPIDPHEALSLYKEFDDRRLAFEEAFPAVCLMAERN
ncbi:MAG: hypothetical protein ACXVIG_03635 [Halobacteriota archaeon]